MDTIVSLKLPPKNYRRTIEELSVVIPDPALKLKFLKQALDEYQKLSEPDTLDPAIAETSFQNNLLDKAEEIWPGSKKAATNSVQTDVIAVPGVKRSRHYKLRYVIGSAILFLSLFWIGPAVSPLVRSPNPSEIIHANSQQAKTANTKIIIRKSILFSQRPGSEDSPNVFSFKPAKYQNEPEIVLNYFKNPILTALTSHKTNNPQSGPIYQKHFVSSQPRRSGNRPPISTLKPAKHQNESKIVLNYFKNPILTALTSQKTNNPQSGPIYQERFVSSQPRRSGNRPPISTLKSVKPKKGSELVLNYFKNPILTALTSQQVLNSSSEPISQKTLLSSQPQSSRNHLPLPAIKPAVNQNEPELALNIFQNPILMALTSQKTNNPQSGPIYQKPLLSDQPQSSGKHLPLPTARSAKHQNKSVQVSEYLKDPILITLDSQQTKSSKSGRITSKPLLSSQMPGTENHSASTTDKPMQVPKYLKNPIWLVEKTADREFYSNRLQIITTYTISNIPREYYRFSRNSDYSPANSKTTNKISGIVYHASESDLYPFMPEMNRSILSYSKRLIKYLLRKKSYHFFIDRFGRVYRLVQEDHAAFHAGRSIWADDEALYLNLNHAFIGICFEGKDFQEINTGKQKKDRSANSKSSLLKPTGISSFNEAQLRSGKELTDWLRVKYNISQQNCVPHALISVNTKRMLIGFHLDLARGFPFARLGLTDKYQEPLPSMVEFGFRYDKYFEKIFNGNLWRGIGYSEEILRRRARSSGMSFAKYRKSLQQRFTRYTDWKQKLVKKKDQLTKTSNKR